MASPYTTIALPDFKPYEAAISGNFQRQGGDD